MHKGSVESGQVTVGDVLDVEVNANLRHRARSVFYMVYPVLFYDIVIMINVII